MTDYPRISTVPVEAWTGPEDDPVPVWRRITSFAVPFAVVALVWAFVPWAAPWGVVAAVVVVAIVQTVRDVRRARGRGRRTS